jgi:hypothetical protein
LSNWSKLWWEVKLMVVELRLEWNRLLDMYKSVYLVTTIRKSFLIWGRKMGNAVEKNVSEKMIYFCPDGARA